jgi:hypothetical protein
MTRPSPEGLLEEAARLAYHYHWPLDTILDLEHGDRRRFLQTAEELASLGGQEMGWTGEGQFEEPWE